MRAMERGADGGWQDWAFRERLPISIVDRIDFSFRLR